MLMAVQGILGGTFDPPHIAHLAMARAAERQLVLDVIRLMPAGDPWQKADTGVSDLVDRLAMAELLAQEEPFIVVDETELDRQGPTYTIETVEGLDEKCVLILGADAALGVPSWHRADELIDLVEFAVVPRPGTDRGDVDAAIGRPITWLDVELSDISSTRIRKLARSGASIKELVPPSVAGYIDEHSLYGSGEKRRTDSLSSPHMIRQPNTATAEATEAARAVATALEAKAGENLAILDLSDLLVVTDVFVLVTGTSRRNVLTLADEAVEALRALDRQPIRKEGIDHGQWILLDYGDVIIHVFDRQTREYYDLERLWAGAPRIEFESTSSTTEP